MSLYTSDQAVSRRRADRQARLRREAEQRSFNRQRKRQAYLGTQLAAQRYLHMAYANGATSFRPDIYERATAGQKTAVSSPSQKGDKTIMKSEQITRIELSKTQSGKPVINLYGQPQLKYPVLQLFDLSMLQDACIDPNQLEPETAVYARFTAYYEESDKLNQKGNPYKDIVRLETSSHQPPATSSQTDSLLADILLELKAIRAIILTQSHTEPETAVSPNISKRTWIVV